MAKYYGEIGYCDHQVESAPGVWEDVIVEKASYGDVLRNYRYLSPGDQANDDITVSNLISIVMDAYAQEHFSDMRYIRWMGNLWYARNVEVLPPRLNITLGVVYNGPTAGLPQSPDDFDGE